MSGALFGYSNEEDNTPLRGSLLRAHARCDADSYSSTTFAAPVRLDCFLPSRFYRICWFLPSPFLLSLNAKYDRGIQTRWRQKAKMTKMSTGNECQDRGHTGAFPPRFPTAPRCHVVPRSWPVPRYPHTHTVMRLHTRRKRGNGQGHRAEPARAGHSRVHSQRKA